MSAVCHKCNQIIEKPYCILNALGKTWHPFHFVCTECAEPIDADGSTTFSLVQNEVICNNCFQRNHAEVCCCCDKPIFDERVLRAANGIWHQNCFRCVNCGVKLESQDFYEVNCCIFCERDFKAFFAVRCTGCKEPIMQDAVVALDTKWHRKCFKCISCKKPLKSGKFALQTNGPICLDCSCHESTC